MQLNCIVTLTCGVSFHQHIHYLMFVLAIVSLSVQHVWQMTTMCLPLEPGYHPIRLLQTTGGAHLVQTTGGAHWVPRYCTCWKRYEAFYILIGLHFHKFLIDFHGLKQV